MSNHSHRLFIFCIEIKSTIRQLCIGKAPKPKPTKEFWKLLNTLYSVHNSFQKCAKYEHSTLEICKEIECLILDLQEAG